MPGARMPHHADRHDADRARAGDEHVLAEDVKREGRMDGISKGVKDGLHVARDVAIVMPYVAHRNGDVLGEGARTVHTDSLRVLAEVPPAGEAVAAAAADYVSFAADDVARMEVIDVRAHLDDLADE